MSRIIIIVIIGEGVQLGIGVGGSLAVARRRLGQVEAFTSFLATPESSCAVSALNMIG